MLAAIVNSLLENYRNKKYQNCLFVKPIWR